MAEKIIIDTDPGIDDSIAILTALQSPELQILGLTSIFGNAEIEKTTQNALRLIELAGKSSIPVAHGSATPLVIPLLEIAMQVHGGDGLGNTNPAPSKGKPVEKSAAEFIVDCIQVNPHEVTLLPIGPLTNIALALKLEPGIVGLVKQIIIMGGAISTAGNISPVAEANFYHDPHAAGIVLGAGWPVVIVSLDVTHKTVMTQSYLDEIYGSKNPLTDFLKRILPYYQQFHDQFYGMGGAIHTHDPSAVCYLLDPGLYQTENVPVHIETSGLCMGQSIADRHHQWQNHPDVKVCMDVNAAGVLSLIKNRLTQ